MHRQISFMGPRANIFRSFASHHGSAGKVMRVLDRNQSGRGDVISGIEMQRTGDFIPGQNATAVIALDGSRYSSGEGGHRGSLEVVDMVAFFDHNVLTAPRL